MPILGKTDRASAPRRWMQLGTIRKGTKDKDGGLIDLPYFRFVPKKGPDAEALQRIWAEAYGDKPTKIEIFLPFDDVEGNWQTWKESYGTSGLKFRCNGKYHVRWLKEDLTYESDYATAQQRLCPYCSGERERTKKDLGDTEVGYLSAKLIPFFEKGYTGTVTFVTTALNDVFSITEELYVIDDEARASGISIRSIAFNLVRVEEEISQRWVDEDGRAHKKRGPKSMVHLLADPKWVLHNMQNRRQKAFAMIHPSGEVKMLTDGESISSPASMIDEVGTDAIDAEFNVPPTEPGPQRPPPSPPLTPPPPAKPPQTDASSRRPFAPMDVMQTLQDHVERRRGQMFFFTADARHKAEWKIKKTLENVLGNEMDAHLFLQFVVKESTFALMDDAEIETLRKYFIVREVDGEWVLDEAVGQEIRDIVQQQREVTGQKPLFEEAEEEVSSPDKEEDPTPVEEEEVEDSIFLSDWEELGAPDKRKYAESLFREAKARGMKPMSFTDETVDAFIKTVQSMIWALDDEAGEH